MPGVVIIGAGECGVRAAFALRELDYHGSITLLSGETTLPYERPPLSKGGGIRLIRDRQAYADAGIDLQLGSAVDALELDAKRVRLQDGTLVGFDKALLSTGARARQLASLDGCVTFRTDQDAAKILAQVKQGASLGIIGGGFIGLELAATAQRAGASVTVIESAPRVLMRSVPELIAHQVSTRHEAEGVLIRTRAIVQRADARNITLADGSVLGFDLVVAGVGAEPNTDLAQAAGLAVDDGVLVNSFLQTTYPDIFAAGDCCRFPWRGRSVRLESWKAAQDQGAHVARAMLGNREDYAGVPWFWSDHYDLSLQVAGLFEPGLQVVERELRGEGCLVFQCDDRGRLIAAAGIGPGNAIAKDIRLCEKLIERNGVIDPAMLSDPGVNLKKLLKAKAPSV